MSNGRVPNDTLSTEIQIRLSQQHENALRDRIADVQRACEALVTAPNVHDLHDIRDRLVAVKNAVSQARATTLSSRVNGRTLL